MPYSKDKLQKAAKILLALGQDNAAQILQFFDNDTIEKVLAEVVQIDGLDEKEKAAVLKDFQDELKAHAGTLSGGKEEAKKLLISALGASRASKFITKLDYISDRERFREIENYSPENVARVLNEELPQTISVVLAHIRPKFAAKILIKIEDAVRAQVAGRLAKMNKLHPEVVNATFHTILSRLEKLDDEDYEVAGGEAALTEILNHMDVYTEEKILNAIDEDDPDMAARIKENLVVFEDFIDLTPREIRKIVDSVPDIQVWAKALKGAGRDLTRHILSGLSINRSSDIVEEMKLIGGVTLADIDDARKILLNAANELDQMKKIILRKDKEEMIE